MMVRLRVVVSIACSSALALAAFDASVYTLDSNPHSDHKVSSLSPENARLWIVNRLGLSSFHSLENADLETLSLLNEFGDDQQASIFAPSQSRPRKLVVVEGVERPEDFFGKEGIAPAFHISASASSSLTSQFALDLLDQDKVRRGARNQCQVPYLELPIDGIQGGFSLGDPLGTCYLPKAASTSSKNLPVTDKLGIIRSHSRELAAAAAHVDQPIPPSATSDYTSIFVVSILDDITQEHGQGSVAYRDATAALKEALLSPDKRQQVTVICMPRSSTQSNTGSANERGTLETSRVLHRRQEQPLSQSPSPAGSKPAQSTNPSNSTIPKTTIPTCYSSEAACTSSTSSCAGHGICRKKYTEKVSKDEEGAECWACLCEPTHIKNGNSVKTIYWGGPACQKKDVSVPFFLFAGFTVAAVAAVSYGIGLLYSVGDEDLPSVLGAGVAPTIRK